MDMEKDTETDLEQECEDAVFDLCDTRERYPTKCAEELGKYLRLTTQINSASVKIKPSDPLKPLIITDEQHALFNRIKPFPKERADNQKALEIKLQTMLKTVKDLKKVVEQVKRAEDCTIDKILKKNDKDT